MKRISRMIIFPIKEEKSKKKTNKNKTNKRTNFKADELRPITTSEVFEVVYFVGSTFELVYLVSSYHKETKRIGGIKLFEV